jgi:hypothetical protein
MRQPLILLCLVGVAHAGGDPLKPKPVDVKPMIDKLDVYRDDAGMYFVTLHTPTASSDDDNLWLFYGDAKVMYRQRVIGYSSQSGVLEWNLWGPRVRGMQWPTLTLKANKVTLECKRKEAPRVMNQLPADQARAFVQHTTFMPPLWQRQTHILARDEEGVYYFVDELQEEYGGKGFRVFVGQKGAMKELPMTNVVNDSAGEIFATKTGELKIVTSEDGKAYWKKGGKKSELIKLDPFQNRYVIYRELGIYGALGAVCDDQ